jgi:hypothetical protein
MEDSKKHSDILADVFFFMREQIAFHLSEDTNLQLLADREGDSVLPTTLQYMRTSTEHSLPTAAKSIPGV